VREAGLYFARGSCYWIAAARRAVGQGAGRWSARPRAGEAGRGCARWVPATRAPLGLGIAPLRAGRVRYARLSARCGGDDRRKSPRMRKTPVNVPVEASFWAGGLFPSSQTGNSPNEFFGASIGLLSRRIGQKSDRQTIRRVATPARAGPTRPFAPSTEPAGDSVFSTLPSWVPLRSRVDAWSGRRDLNRPAVTSTDPP